MKSLEQAEVTGKQVLVRLDLNVPLTTGSQPVVANDFRLKAVLPTLNYLINRQAKVVILSHLGRPDGQPKPSLSLRPVYLHLSALLKKPIAFAPTAFSDLTKAAVTKQEEGSILGLENLRFDPGEDSNSRTFARKLASFGEVYVDDAFSNAHRQAASIVAITEFLPSYAGFLLEKEYLVLTNLLRHPVRPFIGIIGGAKIEDKLPVVKNLLQRVDRLLVGGGVANTFLAAQGQPMKKSLIEPELLPEAKRLLQRGGSKIILPTDFVWHDDRVLDLGPKTITQYKQFIHPAKTIFWAGSLGQAEQPAFAKASEEIAYSLADCRATTVVGGGNTVEIISRLKLTNRLSFVSTGGGATLHLLAGQPLPGITALE